MNLPDSATRDEHERLEREDETIREQRWAEFVAYLQLYTPHAAFDVVRRCSDAMSPYEFHETPMMRRLRAFAETEGWSGVLVAIAQALKEIERDLAQQTDPRRV